MDARGYFGFETRDNRRRASSPIEKFIVECEKCQDTGVRFRLFCDDGEATLTLACGRCGETSRVPSKLLDGI